MLNFFFVFLPYTIWILPEKNPGYTIPLIARNHSRIQKGVYISEPKDFIRKAVDVYFVAHTVLEPAVLQKD